MFNFRSLPSMVLLSVVGMVMLVGCSDQSAAPPVAGSKQPDDWKQGLDDDIVSGLSQLSDADRTAALAQKVCPVTDKTLDSMGKPLKVTIEGQDVFLCCGGCEETLKEEPAKYLAKLNKN